MKPPAEFDCLVVGAGPAGSVLATILRDWGRTVVLVGQDAPERPWREETLSADATGPLKRHGLLASVRAHGFEGLAERRWIWGDGTPQNERGFRVDRKKLDDDARAIAGSRGVFIVKDAQLEPPLNREPGVAQVLCDAGGQRHALRPRSIAVAAGRDLSARWLPLSLVRQLPETLALTAVFDAEPSEREAVFIEAVPEGWLWWLPRSDGRAALTLFCDLDECREVGEESLFDAARRAAAGPARRTGPPGELHVSNATPRLVTSPSDCLLLGDSASTVDPLTNLGVEKAIRSAEQAAVAIQSLLEMPDLSRAILDRHAHWEHELWMRGARSALHGYLRETRFSDRPFWQQRHAAVAVEFETDEPARLPSVLRLAEGVRRRTALVRRDRVYVEMTGFGLPGTHQVYDELGRVPLAPLMSLLQSPLSTDDILDQAAAHPALRALPRQALQRTLTELWQKGIIVAAPED